MIERHIVTSLLTLMMLVSVAGCGTSGPEELDRHSIESMRGDFGLVGRSVIRCPAGDCIILHFPPTQAESIRGMTEAHTVEDTVNAILKLDDDDPNNDGEILVPEARWAGAEADQLTLDTFNCCAYAVGDLLDLGEGDWLNPSRRNTTNQTCPFQIVLDSYFREVQRVSLYDINWSELESSPSVRDGDLVCFSSSSKNELECIHVGTVQKRDGKNWLISKVGQGPIVRGSLASTGKTYLLGWDVLVVYRLRSGP